MEDGHIHPPSTISMFHAHQRIRSVKKLLDQDAENTNKADYEKLIAARVAQGATFAHLFFDHFCFENIEIRCRWLSFESWDVPPGFQ